MADRKISYAKFVHPVWVDGLGMVDSLDSRTDPDTKAPKDPVTMTWLAEDRLLRVSCKAGETLLSVACSLKPVYEDRVKSSKP